MPSTTPRPLTPERRRARALAFRRWRDKQAAYGLVRLRVFVPATEADRWRSLLEARTVAYLAEREERALVASEPGARSVPRIEGTPVAHVSHRHLLGAMGAPLPSVVNAPTRSDRPSQTNDR